MGGQRPRAGTEPLNLGQSPPVRTRASVNVHGYSVQVVLVEAGQVYPKLAVLLVFASTVLSLATFLAGLPVYLPDAVVADLEDALNRIALPAALLSVQVEFPMVEDGFLVDDVDELSFDFWQATDHLSGVLLSSRVCNLVSIVKGHSRN